jgi:Amt family ammonium transporter
MAAIAIGLAAGAVCYGGVLLKNRFTYDDSLDVFGVHGVGGLLGALLTGVFASKLWNPAGNDGLIHGNSSLVVEQLMGAAAAAAYAGVATFVVLKGLEKVMGLRAAKEDEQEGLDTALHGEEAYALGGGPGARALEEEPVPEAAPQPALVRENA